MSAYLLDPKQFARLTQFFRDHHDGFSSRPPCLSFYNVHTRQPVPGANGNDLQWIDIPLMLARENLTSVSHRYPGAPYGGFLDDDGGSCASLVNFLGECADQFRRPHDLLTPPEAWDLCGRYDYQSCEHPGYWQSDAAVIIERIRHHAGECMRQELLPDTKGWAA